jgi:hypothetical protein
VDWSGVERLSILSHVWKSTLRADATTPIHTTALSTPTPTHIAIAPSDTLHCSLFVSTITHIIILYTLISRLLSIYLVKYIDL